MLSFLFSVSRFQGTRISPPPTKGAALSYSRQKYPESKVCLPEFREFDRCDSLSVLEECGTLLSTRLWGASEIRVP